VVAFALTTVGGIVAYLFRSRVKLIWGSTNNSYHRVSTPDGGTANIYAEEFYIRNSGRKPAEKVDVVFAKQPTEISVFPSREHDRAVLQDGCFKLTIPYVSPSELVIVDTLDINATPSELRFVTCPQAAGKRVAWWVTRRLPMWVNVLMFLVCFTGMITVVQVALRVTALLATGLAR
jgi:hypothetical protein